LSKDEKKEKKALTGTLKERLLKNSTLKDALVLSDSRLFEEKEIVTTNIPALNIALSGDAFSGGMVPGLIQIAAESQHFKSKFAIELVNAFLTKFPEGIVLFYDSEYGTPESYFQGVNVDNIIHCPVLNLEQFKNDIVKQLNMISRDDKVLVLVDSLGNMPTIKELKDSLEEKDTQDMTRAKAMKSVFRMIMPLINSKDIYAVMVNHTYKTIEMFSKDVPTGGTGSIYNSNVIWTITKKKDKEDKETKGFQFTICTYKSRFIKADTKIPIMVYFDEGIKRWSGMLDLAIEAGYVIRPTAQSYARSDKPTETYKATEIEDNEEFWNSLFKETNFNEWIKKEYKI
jgi:RecA/RadA recombinase